jgi:hypothetical protein
MQYRIEYEYLLSFSDEMMNLADIQEFRTTWNNELFWKNKSTVVTAKRLIKKSIVIGKDESMVLFVLIRLLFFFVKFKDDYVVN